MKTSFKILGLALIAIATLASQASAQFLIAADNFDRADGSLTGTSPTPGPGSVWTSHSGTEGDLLITGGQAVVEHGIPSEDNHIIFTPQNTGILTATFDITVSDDTVIEGGDYEYFAHFMPDGTFDFRSRLDIVAPNESGDYTLGISSGSSTAEAILPTDLTFGTTYSVTLEFDFATGLGSVTVDGNTAVGTGVYADETLDSFALRQSDSSNNETILVDNLQIFGATEPAGDTWRGYPVRPDGYVDTTPWMGWVYVGADPWIWVVNLGKYVYINDDSGWVYVPK